MFHAYLQTSLIKDVIYEKPLLHHLLRHHLKAKGLRYDLSVVAFVGDSMLTSLDKIKDRFDLWHSDLSAEDQTMMLARDGKSLVTELVEKIHQQNQDLLLDSIELPLIDILAECEHEGFCVRQDVLESIALNCEVKISELTDSIYTLVSHPFNLNSPKQMAEVLFDELQLPTGKKRSTAVDALEALKDLSPVIEMILEYRKYQKLYSTYAIGLQKYISEDQKIHTILNQTTASTGRLSSSDPNLQNISVRNEETREIRKAFIPSEGNCILSIDYSQIELRMLAHLADETTLIDAFNHGIDIHTKTACDLFGVAIDQVDGTMRRAAKTVNFGIIYGISEYGLAQQLGISTSTAKAYITTYLNTYSRIADYMNRMIEQCQRDGYVTTMFGRRREIPEIHDKNYAVREFGKRAAMNAPIQGSAADLIKLAMIKVTEVLKEQHFATKMILQVHDELIFDGPTEELERVQKAVSDAMVHVVDLKVPLEVSINSGSNWFEAK